VTIKAVDVELTMLEVKESDAEAVWDAAPESFNLVNLEKVYNLVLPC